MGDKKETVIEKYDLLEILISYFKIFTCYVFLEVNFTNHFVQGINVLIHYCVLKGYKAFIVTKN